MFRTFCPHSLRSVCVITFASLLISSQCLAQDASNKRGFQPGNSFANGDFETINTTNGNLMLRFPLGGLPAGRNGLTAGINLFYNSKLLDSETKYFLKENEDCEIIGGAGEGIVVCPYYQKQMLKESEQGGWQFGMGYSLKLIDRHDEFNNIPWEKRPQCWNSGIYSGSPGYYEMRYHYKLMLIMPDGSSHEMRPNGWSDGNGNDPLGDYFDIRPDGYLNDCQGVQWHTAGITYYSIDGSFLRLHIQYDGNTEWGWQDNPWTLYMPDGSKVTNLLNEPQRFYDRNDNYVEFVGNQIRDQFNRSISISTAWVNGSPVHTITSQGFGETLTWTVNWKWISVLKNYWPCPGSFTCVPEIQQQESYGLPRLVVDTITLPAQAGGLTYRFSYNAPNYVSGLLPSDGWGEISGITLPSGAEIEYHYAQDGYQPDSSTVEILQNSPASKVVSYNQEYDGSSVPTTETWTYGIGPHGSTITGPDGGVTATEFVDTSGAFWNSGLTYLTVGPDGTKTETIWDKNNLANFLISNPYPRTVFTSIKNAAGTYVKTSIKDFKYDKNGNVTRIAEYDWVNYGDVPRDGQGWPTGLPAGASPTRVTVNTYFNSTPDATQFAGSNQSVYWGSGSPRVKNALASTEVRKVVSGVETAVTRVENTYDNASAPANLTQVRTWDSVKGSYSNPLTTGNSLTITMQYNQYGMPTLTTDPRGLKTQTTYGPIGSVSDLYPTQIKNAYQTAQERTESRQYDLGTGIVTQVTDVDNNVSVISSFDAFGRPTLVRSAANKPEETKTAFEYSDTLRRVITRTDLVGTDKVVSIAHFDQLGRIRLSRQLENTSQSATDETHGIKVQTRYRFSGANSFLLTSNSYRATTSGGASAETTMGWTRSKADNAGRIVEVQTFGGVSLPAPWGSSTTSTGTVTTTYDANVTTVADQAQKQRRSVIDGLGRLIRVDEPDTSGNLGLTTSPNQPTHYTYDVLGNLTRVTQSDGVTTQNRDFIYSSLARLTRATNPESGQIDYQYDESGNLTVKTDARLSVHYAYDSLNRVTRRWYNASNSVTATTHNSPALSSAVGTTDETKFYYDAQALPSGAPSYSRGASMGRLVATTYGTASNGDYFAYDFLGRSTLKIQQVGAINYQMSAAYNLAGAMTSLTYPSGRVVNNTYDQAGRLLAFSGNLGDGTTRNYATGVLYSSGGALVKEQFGTTTPVYNKLFYNSRGQLAEIRVSTSYTGPTDVDANRGAIVNNYSDQCTGRCSGSSMTDNNGNLRKQEIHIPSQTMRWQQYSYDSLNRLKSAREVLNGGAEQWKQEFNYDRFGNRTINTAVTYGTGINNKAFAVTAGNNRLGVPAGQSGVMTYDAVGNLTNDTYTGAGNRTYDGENKITSAWGGNNQAQLYSYDGTGQRIKRTVDGVETWHVYGFGGELLSEYPVNGASASPKKEYGYRNGHLLVTAEPFSGSGGGSAVNVVWTNGVGVSISGNNLTRTAAGDAWNAGAVSSQSIASGDGYAEFTATETNKNRTMGLTDNTSVTGYQHIDYAIYLGDDGQISIHEGLNAYGAFGTYVAGDKLRVAVEGGVVKYRKNGTLLRTSALAPAYPLYAGGATYTNASTVTGAVLSVGGGSSSVQLNWLVPDHLGTPRMILDQSGSLASMKRHDYLPFGEELFAPTGGRTAAMGYASGDGIRQQFTLTERDIESGLDYFNARYYSSAQGRFTNPDPFGGSGFVSVPQSWNKYVYCLNRPFVFTDPSGQIWLTTNNKEFIWIEDDKYKKNQSQYRDYSVANGAVTNYQSSSNCPQCANVSQGQWVQLNADGSVMRIADPTTYVYAQYTDQEVFVPTLVGGVQYPDLEGGPKNRSWTFDRGGGKRTERWFDNNGRAWVDIDYGDGEPVGDPHVHWWDWNVMPPSRSQGEAVPEGWDLFMWDDGSPGVNPNRPRRQEWSPYGIPVYPMDVPTGVPFRPMVPLRPMVPRLVFVP